MKKGTFLGREVLKDSKGLFVHYGTWHVRAPKNTKARKGMVVYFPHNSHGYFFGKMLIVWKKIFPDGELWT